MNKIIPIRDLRDTAKISEMCHSTHEPIFVTRNGYSDMVIMSAEVYSKLVERREPRRESAVKYHIEPDDSAMVAEPVDLNYGIVYTVEEIRRILAPIFKKHGVKRAVLFGSYAKGLATARSDIDIVVDSGLKGLAFFGLLNDVSEAFRVPVDLIDSSQVRKGSAMESEIAETGVLIYA